MTTTTKTVRASEVVPGDVIHYETREVVGGKVVRVPESAIVASVERTADGVAIFDASELVMERGAGDFVRVTR